jgi:precorrin-2 dehydrogenase/sirohydrochlorin ferrochelatase
MYPVFLDITGQLCVVVGGGGVAERKVKALLREGAAVRLVSPRVTGELAFLAGAGRIEWREKSYTDSDLDDAFLVFAATDDRQVQQAVCRQAGANCQLVNVADDPGCCSFHVPATVRRGDLALAVSTGGKSPAAAAFIRERLEQEYGPEYEIMLELMSRIRQKIMARADGLSPSERKKIYKKILHNDIIEWIRTAQSGKLREHLQEILDPEDIPDIHNLNLDH